MLRSSCKYLFAFLIIVLFGINVPTAQAVEFSSGSTATIEYDLTLKGVSIMAYGNTWGTTEEKEALLNRFSSLGVNSISLSIPLYTYGPFSNNFYTNSKLTPDEDQLTVWARLAHERGMTILLRPLLDESNLPTDGRYYWRGNIAPTNVETWFAEYTKWMLYYAEIAEKLDIETLSVGAEFNSMERYGSNWLQLIRQVRSIYSGRVIYCANWADGQTLINVPFWFALDAIGIDAFFDLDAPAYSNVSNLVEAWQYWVPGLKALQQKTGKPIIFTEVGCRSTVGCFQNPWKWEESAMTSQVDQSSYYAATCQVVKDLGIYGTYWWSTGRELPSYNPDQDRDYNFLYKTAETTLRNCYTQ